jgi:hypothetical protein
MVVAGPFLSARQLSLRRLVRSRAFVNLHELTVAWLDSHFQAPEHGVPWLHRIGAEVYDRCTGRGTPSFWLGVFEQRTGSSSGRSLSVVSTAPQRRAPV